MGALAHLTDAHPRRGDSAGAADRRARAVRLRLGGASYDTIAKDLGLASRASAWKLVQRALRDRVFEEVDQYRELELQRLDALQAAHWGAAVAGDVKAALLVLKIIEQRVKLLCLDQPASFQEPETIIRSDHFIEDLRAVIGD